MPSKLLEEELKKRTHAEIRFDSITQQIYSVDASIFEILPLGVALPRSLEDLIEIVKIAHSHLTPLTPRGSATGITGGCLGKGLIVDTSKHLNQILSIDIEKGYAVCEPGVIQDDLNRILNQKGYRLGPDTSTGDRATLGGMAANNAAGARSLYYGTMSGAIEAISLILSNGEKVEFKSLDEESWNKKCSLKSLEGDIYREINAIRKNYAPLIQERFPRLPRRSSGYNLLEIIRPFPVNLAKLIVGSEGTLGIIASLTVKIVPILKATELHLYPFESMNAAMQAVQELIKTNPISLELIDDKILKAGFSAPSLRGKLNWLKIIPKALLVAEYKSPNEDSAPLIIKTPSEMQHVWDVRKAGLGLLLSKRSYSRAIAFIEDISIPPAVLPEFMQAFEDYLKKKGKEAGIYGHVGSGCLHIRPYMDLRHLDDIILIETMMKEVALLIQSQGGVLSGEHGDGLIRTWLNESFFGEEIYQLFLKIKNVFDPLNLMNPNKIVNPIPLQNFRKSPLQNPETFLKFDGGLALSADLCNGNGACRKQQGVMCPSFQVTHDEFDSTRARANVMRNLLQSDQKADLGDVPLHEILERCIQCKGCKTECPSQVDMAKMKSEALFHYQKKHGASLRSTLFAHIDTLNKWTYPLKNIYNTWISSYLGKKTLQYLGIGLPLPHFSKTKFSREAQKIIQAEGKEVVLLSDTYTEFYCNEVGFAALYVLNKLGYKVTIPPWECCGRPAVSKGFLPHAKNNAQKFASMLIPYMEKGIPIIGLEPSCFFMLHDEYRDLLGEKWKPINCYSFEAFLAMHPLNLSSTQTVAIHGHCHHKAFEGMQNVLDLLKSIQGLTVIEIPSGCCGLAGSFGYEAEHTEFSRKIGELTLLPFIRNLDASIPIIASGYSCRTQIELYTNRRALHLAEWLQMIYS